MIDCCLSPGPAVFTLRFPLLALALHPGGPGRGLSLLHAGPLAGLVLLLLLLQGLQLGRGEFLVSADAALTLLGVRLQQPCK